MPNAKHPEKKLFCLYQFEIRGTPFYVGMGTELRAGDRIRYVKSKMKRQELGKPLKWSLSSRVIAYFCHRNVKVRLHFIRKRLSRPRALRLEKRRIESLVASGVVLANCHHNKRRPNSHLEVVRSVLARKRK
jgi:hypothetical protein